jgi:hypothetical protein
VLDAGLVAVLAVLGYRELELLSAELFLLLRPAQGARSLGALLRAWVGAARPQKTSAPARAPSVGRPGALHLTGRLEPRLKA